MKKIVFRTMGGKSIGYGHFYRCFSLAKAIKHLNENVHIIFIINQDLSSLLNNTGFNFIISSNLSKDYDLIDKFKADLVVFDSYLGDNIYLSSIKKLAKLMLIDDSNDIYDSTIPDIIYNGNINANILGYKDVKKQLKLLGTKYLIMKEEYWAKDNDENIKKEGVVVTTGGTDEYAVALKIIEAIKEMDIRSKIIIGPGYRNSYIKKIESIQTKDIELVYKPSSLKKYISESNIVVTAGGSTIYEVLSQGSFPIMFSIADNQDLVCSELSKSGIPYIGKYPNIEYSRLPALFEMFEDKKVELNSEVFNQVNGDGAIIVAKILLEL